MKSVGKHILMFVYCFLLQVMILDNIQGFYWFQPYVYIFFFLYLTPEIPKWSSVLIGFAIGIFFDLFLNSHGVHATAGVIIGFAKPYIAALNTAVAPARENEQGSWLNKARPKFRYYFLLLFIATHHFIVFVLENFNSNFFVITLPAFVISSLSTFVLILISDELFHKTFAKRK
jgi:hypothetical protein